MNGGAKSRLKSWSPILPSWKTTVVVAQPGHELEVLDGGDGRAAVEVQRVLAVDQFRLSLFQHGQLVVGGENRVSRSDLAESPGSATETCRGFAPSTKDVKVLVRLWMNKACSFFC